MIICRTPFRISFFGGGTDYPIWYKENGGSVISATINKYSYITARQLPPFFEYKHRIRYFEQEQTTTLDQIKHPSVRECAKYLQYTDGLEVVHNADLPARSGLGSSSTFTVGMLHALHTLQNYMPTKRELAMQAIHIEQELIGEAVGSQDQTAAAFGGFNQIQFDGVRVIDVNPIVISDQRLKDLQDNLILCFTGFARTASELAKAQIAETPKLRNQLLTMQQLCDEALNRLLSVQTPIAEFGKLLHEQWIIKRGLTKQVSNEKIDQIYETAIKHGAIGGKLLGAGGGGFMIFFAPKDRHAEIQCALNKKMFVPFRFEFTGSKIIYYSHE